MDEHANRWRVEGDMLIRDVSYLIEDVLCRVTTDPSGAFARLRPFLLPDVAELFAYHDHVDQGVHRRAPGLRLLQGGKADDE